MNNIPLIFGLIDAFLFFESAGPEEVNPDSAVKCMEHMTSSLLALSEADQIALRCMLEKISDEAPDQSYRNFVRALPHMIGLAGP